MTTEPLQPITAMSVRDLVNHLNDEYPPRCIGKGETLEQAHRYAGTRELVEALIEIVKLEDEEASTSSRN